MISDSEFLELENQRDMWEERAEDAEQKVRLLEEEVVGLQIDLDEAAVALVVVRQANARLLEKLEAAEALSTQRLKGWADAAACFEKASLELEQTQAQNTQLRGQLNAVEVWGVEQQKGWVKAADDRDNARAAIDRLRQDIETAKKELAQTALTIGQLTQERDAWYERCLKQAALAVDAQHVVRALDRIREGLSR